MKRSFHIFKPRIQWYRLNFIKAIAVFLTLFPFPVMALVGKSFLSGDFRCNVISENEVSIEAVNNSLSGNITIPSEVEGYKVTTIATFGFGGCSNITSITIPEGVTSIGNNVFYMCSGLTSITIPASVTSIGTSAFTTCSGLTSVAFAENSQLTSIGNFAFEDCSSLSSISIPASVTSIGDNAFEDCSGLKKAEFASVESLCAISFGDALANPLYFAKQLYIGNSKVTQLVIPESVTSIGDCAFVCCESITSVVIQGAVGSIGDYAFAGCTGIESLSYAGQNEPSFGEDAMGAVDNLSAVSVTPSYSSDKWGGYPVDMNYSYTTLSETSSQEVNIFAKGKNIIIENADNEVFVYNAQGALVAHEKPQTRVVIATAEGGIYVVKVGGKVTKVVL
ncbi:MAG: leucine-rich repeat domain-containing protein [Bacteroidales bacterium]|nr:leucine-rich repeat domain-containing protein [Bacteroidales bacterium]